MKKSPTIPEILFGVAVFCVAVLIFMACAILLVASALTGISASHPNAMVLLVFGAGGSAWIVNWAIEFVVRGPAK